MEEVNKLIGIMDPNSYAFRVSVEKLFSFLDMKIPYKGKAHHITTRRIMTRPYDVLNAECPYSAILNRGAHWNPHHNSFFMTIGYQTYLLNDMISFKAIIKNTSYGHMFKLGLRIPTTIAIPQQDYAELKKDEKVIPELVFSEHEWFDLEELGKEVGYPAYLKPQDGGGWVGVVRVENYAELLDAYNKSGEKPMNLQKAIDYREFVRTVGIGPQMVPMHYNAKAKLSHDRYMRNENQAIDFNFLSEAERDEVSKICKVINAFYSWDHNSCESLIGHDHAIYPIDFANAYPDSSLVSLHFHFPQIVKNMVRWLTFCAVTEKKKSFNFAQRWPDFFAVAEDKSLSYKEKLDRYAQIADEHFDTKKFNEFCAEYLKDFDARAYDFFAGREFQDIIDREVRYYFKIPQEIPTKIDHYKGLHQFWLHCEAQRLNDLKGQSSTPSNVGQQPATSTTPKQQSPAAAREEQKVSVSVTPNVAQQPAASTTPGVAQQPAASATPNVGQPSTPSTTPKEEQRPTASTTSNAGQQPGASAPKEQQQPATSKDDRRPNNPKEEKRHNNKKEHRHGKRP